MKNSMERWWNNIEKGTSNKGSVCSILHREELSFRLERQYEYIHIIEVNKTQFITRITQHYTENINIDWANSEVLVLNVA
jgi:hypothetical protein